MFKIGHRARFPACCRRPWIAESMRMRERRPDKQDFHQQFLASDRPHLLMVTNHGVHQWRVVPGLPDTGGQNVFVNQFSDSLAQLGYRVTVVNRGGYPHPRTGELQRGLRYRDGAQRILYLEGGLDRFVRKEDMGARVPALIEDLSRFLATEGSEDVIAVLSHYWDGGTVAAGWNDGQRRPRPHIWVPHSLGAVKRRNVAREQWQQLRIDERIKAERELLGSVDAAVATSSTIRSSLIDDYKYEGPLPFLPPCVDPARYHPLDVAADDPIWSFLASHSPLPPREIRQRKIITEISRTDRTKRKDILIRSFAQVQRERGDSLLVVSIDEHEPELSRELNDLIRREGVEHAVVVVGSVWDELPTLYAISAIYCTPSIMEGFGMSAQEAAASAVPVVASQLVPFATEHLLGDDVLELPVGDGSPPLQRGEGAVVASADDVNSFAAALRLLLQDDDLRQAMGDAAYRITIPAFTWPHRTREFLQSVSLPTATTDV